MSRIVRLIREAIASFRHRRGEKPRLTDLPVPVGHRPLSPLPSRAELYEQIYESHGEPRTP